MREVHLDPIGGVAGDMFVAAALDLRPDLIVGLRAVLAGLPLIADVRFDLAPHNDGILTGHRFIVRRGSPAAAEGKAIPPPNTHAHVHWRDIRAGLAASTLDPASRTLAIAIFARLAEAEARVHGIAVEDVGFHEVGAWDSIADIVAAAWLATQMDVARWTIAPLPLGSGRVRTAHGPLPVPAPATARLLEGFLTIDDGIGGERVTPTGAAIIAELCCIGPAGPLSAAPKPRRLTGSGYGFGTRRLPGLSNCLRMLAFEVAEQAATLDDRVAVLECEIDDQTGEDLAQAVDALRRRPGVLDVVQAPVFGKKGRVMTQLRLLADPAALEDLLTAVFTETTTLGIRHNVVARRVLGRVSDAATVDGHRVRVKRAERPLGTTVKAEADDLAAMPGHAGRQRLRRLAEAEAATAEPEETP